MVTFIYVTFIIAFGQDHAYDVANFSIFVIESRQAAPDLDVKACGLLVYTYMSAGRVPLNVLWFFGCRPELPERFLAIFQRVKKTQVSGSVYVEE